MSIKNITQLTLDVDKNEEVVISKKKKTSKPGFIMIGNGKMNKQKIESIDLLAAVADMNSDEKLCFFMVKDSIEFDPYDNRFIYQTPVNTSKLTSSQKSKFSRGYTSLHKKDLVRRVKRGVYMINPNALIASDYAREAHIWNNLNIKNKGK